MFPILACDAMQVRHNANAVLDTWVQLNVQMDKTAEPQWTKHNLH